MVFVGVALIFVGGAPPLALASFSYDKRIAHQIVGVGGGWCGGVGTTIGTSFF